MAERSFLPNPDRRRVLLPGNPSSPTCKVEAAASVVAAAEDPAIGDPSTGVSPKPPWELWNGEDRRRAADTEAQCTAAS